MLFSEVDFRSRLGVKRRPLGSSRAFLFCLCLLPWNFAALAEGSFFDLVEDLPLMPGLVEVREASVVFDKPDGRIVEAYAVGEVEQGRVLAFYRQTLPELGWAPVDSDGYRREGEYLRLRVSRRRQTVMLRISIAPE